MYMYTCTHTHIHTHKYVFFNIFIHRNMHTRTYYPYYSGTSHFYCHLKLYDLLNFRVEIRTTFAKKKIKILLNGMIQFSTLRVVNIYRLQNNQICGITN